MDNPEGKRTSINDLGKFGLIDHITKKAKPVDSTTVTGIGDDGSEVEISAQGWRRQK